MAVKTITIDVEAYGCLKLLKLESESFSDVIKRLFKPPVNVDRLTRQIAKLSPDAIVGIEEAVQSRRKPSRNRRRAI